MIYRRNSNNIINESINKFNDSERILRIPKEYSRNNYIPDGFASYDAINVDHYEIVVPKQIGSDLNRRDSWLLWKLPKSGRYVRIILYMDGGVGFAKDEHKYIIRETDELDRRIILGFCNKYYPALLHACYDKKVSSDIKAHAGFYKAKESPKRIKTGSWGIDRTESIRKYNDLKPYEESHNIFSNVAFV